MCLNEKQKVWISNEGAGFQLSSSEISRWTFSNRCKSLSVFADRRTSFPAHLISKTDFL